MGSGRVPAAQVDRQMGPSLRIGIAGIAVGLDDGAPLGAIRYEVLERLPLGVGNPLEPDASGIVGVDDLDAANDRHLPDQASALSTFSEGVALLPERNERLVDLHFPREPRPIRVDHRSSQLLQDKPGGLVCDSELRLKLEGGDAVGMGCDQIGGQEPFPERQVRAVHDGSGDHRGLVAAPRRMAHAVRIDMDALAFPDKRPRLQTPAFGASAMRALETALPPLPGEVVGTGVVVREVGRELLERRRSVAAPACWKELRHAAP